MSNRFRRGGAALLTACIAAGLACAPKPPPKASPGALAEQYLEQGNALEAVTAYLLGDIIGLRVASLWLVADSLYEPITWRVPSPRLGWQEGWESLVTAGLEMLVAAEMNSKQ